VLSEESWKEELKNYRPTMAEESLTSLYVGHLTICVEKWTRDLDLEEIVKEAGMLNSLVSLLFFENKLTGKSRG
jgi:hypothetical protein